MSIVLGLRKIGVNIPYFDNLIYATKMKFAEIKFNRLQKAPKEVIKSTPLLKEPIRIPKGLKPAKIPVITKGPFNGRLKI